MPDPGSISRWIDDLRAGRDDAADALWRPYYERLVGLARRKLGDVPKRVADEEDVVISAFQSFCAGAAAGRFPKLSDRDDLWQVLVMLTVRKAINQRKRETAQKRGVGRVRGESAFLDPSAEGEGEREGIAQVVDSLPSPDMLAELIDELERLFDRLDDDQRQLALWRLESYSNREIAQRLERTIRWVERKFRLIRHAWMQETPRWRA